MVDIRPNVLPDAILPLRTGDALIVDQGTDGVRQVSPFALTDSVAPVASQSDAQVGTDNTKRMTPLRTKQSIASEVGVSLASNAQGSKADSAVQNVNGKTGNSVSLDKSDVGLGNVDNTSDINKPVSTATQTALDAKANSSVNISSGTGLIGGGDLSENRSLALSSTSIASLSKADSSIQPGDNKLIPSGGVSGQVLGWGNGTTRVWTDAGTGDMAKSVYDPTSQNSNAFNGFPISTRSAMKSIDVTKFNCLYLTESGREGAFILKSGTPPVSDTSEGVYVISNTSGFYWERVLGGDSLMASWFGVKGDDAGDYTAQINEIITVSSILGRRSILLPPGIIRHGGPINITTGYITIMGSGTGATTLRRTHLVGNRFNPSVGISSISIRDMSMDVLDNGFVTSGVEFPFEKSGPIFLENLVISGGFYQISLLGCYDAHVTNVSTTFGSTTPAGRIGIYVGLAGDNTWGGNIFISDTNVVCPPGGGSPGATTGLKVDAVDGIFVSNCYFGYFNDSAVMLDNHTSGWLTGVHIDSCWLDHALGNGLTLNGTTGTNFSNIKITDSVIWGGEDAVFNVRIEGTPSDVIISNVRAGWVLNDNIRLNSTVGRTQVLGCILSQADSANSTGGAGIFVGGGADYVLNNNIINGESTTDNGIQLNGGSEIIVSGNRVKSCVNGIITQTPVNGYIITNNNTRGVSGTGIIDSSTGVNKVVSNNL